MTAIGRSLRALRTRKRISSMSSGHVKGIRVKLLEPRLAPVPLVERYVRHTRGMEGLTAGLRKREPSSPDCYRPGQHQVKMRDVAFGCHRVPQRRLLLETWSRVPSCWASTRHHNMLAPSPHALHHRTHRQEGGREEATGWVVVLCSCIPHLHRYPSLVIEPTHDTWTLKKSHSQQP